MVDRLDLKLFPVENHADVFVRLIQQALIHLLDVRGTFDMSYQRVDNQFLFSDKVDYDFTIPLDAVLTALTRLYRIPPLVSAFERDTSLAPLMNAIQ